MSTSALSAYWANVREFFTLRETEARSRALPSATRESLETIMPLAEQRIRAAELLFDQGARAEGLRLARESWTMLRPLADEVVVGGDWSSVDAALSRPLPRLDEDVADADRDAFDLLVDRQRSLRLQLQPFAGAAEDVPRLRRRRIGRLIGASVALLAAASYLLLRPTVQAEASASWGGRYLAENAIDGAPHTSWLLPDRTTGWIDFHLSPARHVHSLSVTNPPDHTYGVLDYRLEAWSRDRLVKTVDGKLPPPAGTVNLPTEIPFDTGERVNRIRLVVKSYHDYGGGIAEMAIH